MIRTLSILSFVACSVGLLFACSDDSSSGSGTNNGTGSGAYKDCNTSSTGDAGSSCTQAELQPYTDCVTACGEPTYKTCFGENYKSGSFGGACGPYITCSQKCACNDNACQQACARDQACTDCLKPVTNCATGCFNKLPACATGGSNLSDSGLGGGKTCADLEACCNSLSGDDKTTCEQGKTGAGGIDFVCSTILTTSYKTKCAAQQ